MLGSVLREYLPKFYFLAVEIKNKLTAVFQSDVPYITDSLGGSFKTYLHRGNKDQIVRNLKRGLDGQSKRTVDVLVQRFLAYPDENEKNRARVSSQPIGGYLPCENPAKRSEVDRAMVEVRSKFDITPKIYDESVFYYQHGLRFMPGSVVQSFRNKDFIDCGAYIGDSALSLSNLNFKKIYSIEISKKSISKYIFNMKKNQIGDEKYEIIEMGITSRDDREPLILPDTGSAGLSLVRKYGKYDYIQVIQKSLDYIVDEYKIKPGFIKADIEGGAYEMVVGGIRTLTNYRPVLSIAIYHNPKEFFEIKPYLESRLKNYTFLIRKLDSSLHRNHCHSEVVLLGYPNELKSN